MPTYEYKCEQCGHHFDEFQSITAKPLKKCPQCGENKLRKMIGCGAAIIFKGNGFYQTDYRSDSYQKAAQADKESSTSKSKSAESSKSSSSSKSSPASSESPARPSAQSTKNKSTTSTSNSGSSKK